MIQNLLRLVSVTTLLLIGVGGMMFYRHQTRQSARIAELEADNFKLTDLVDRPMTPRRFVLRGERIHVDGLVVKFEQQSVREDDPMKGHAVLLLEKIYGDATAPADADRIDRPGEIPQVYQNTAPGVTAFEQTLWRDFWTLMHDESDRKRRGVDVVHGAGVFAPFKPGFSYEITLTPQGNLTLHASPIPPAYQAMLGK
jgi:hypothetical protein